MALKPILTADEHAGIADSLKEHYISRDDGSFVLDVPVDEHPSVAGLKSALQKEREAAQRASARLKELESSAGEPDDDDATLDSKISRLRSNYDKKINELSSERDKLNARVKRLSITEAASRAVGNAKGRMPLLLPHITEVADVLESGQVIIRGADGKPLLRKGWTALEDYASLDEYVLSLRDDPVWSVAFESNNATGDGAEKNRNKGRTTEGRVVTRPDGGIVYK